jgi:hypothetical protein
MSTLSTVYMKQSQRVSAAQVAGRPPSLDHTTGAGRLPSSALFKSPFKSGLVDISEDARMRAAELGGQLDGVQPMLMDKLQGDLLNMMLERLTGESMTHGGFEFPTATADTLGWFAERYGVPRPPRHRPQSFGATMASHTGQSQSVEFSAHAMVSTADGQEVRLAVELVMAQTSLGASFWGQNTHLSDPLVAAFAGQASQLSQSTFQFNLGVQWSGMSTSGGHQGSTSTFSASSPAIQRAFFQSMNGRYNEGERSPSVTASPTTAAQPTSTTNAQPVAANAPSPAPMPTTAPESAPRDSTQGETRGPRTTALPKATMRWIA